MNEVNETHEVAFPPTKASIDRLYNAFSAATDFIIDNPGFSTRNWFAYAAGYLESAAHTDDFLSLFTKQLLYIADRLTAQYKKDLEEKNDIDSEKISIVINKLEKLL